ncbi:hypothetical protein NL676_018418 [Syzygium grande]|nr:hypothetical protein NL676_018418 [Syzygium grande]
METPERRESCGCGCERPVPHASFAKRRPPGLVFYPLDHQLIAFLRRKLSGRPLRPPHPFMDLNVYKHTPQQLSAKDADYNSNSNNNHKGTTGENDMQLEGYVICKIHRKRSKSESDDHKEEGRKTGQRKRKSVASTKDGCKAPHKDPGNDGSHAESSSPVPGPNDGAPLEPWGQAPIAELPSVCGGVPTPDQTQQQPQAAKKGTVCFEDADTLDDPGVNAPPLDMFDWWETQEQQQQTANDGAINYSYPNTPTDQAAAVDFNPANNASDDSILNGANTIRGLSLAHEDGSAFTADFGDDLLDSNGSSLWRHFDYKRLMVVEDI